ncbi:minor capsid protein [Streptomyces sp. RKAG293]|uniref:minor capsid protein n=1 Tax=Streptomyces sp. RKAG293 TaxID=2893403 RepID=UPI0020344C52|nr:minor capsid protein [Streptomyces sp. RKAG293]MCM2420305.1 minor capsid protein [Streptomyces sp. RKAG293]
MTYTVDLLDGLARLLDTAGAGIYRPDGLYAADETAITIATIPPAPDRVICLSAYPVTDSPVLTDTTTGIQVRTRAGPDPRVVDALDDAVFDVLHGAGPLLLGAARVQLLFRVSAAPIGADSAGRMERSANYYARAHRAAPHLE